MGKHLTAYLALDGKGWEESAHPRDDSGKFAKGSGGGSNPAGDKGAIHAAKTQEDLVKAANFKLIDETADGFKTYENEQTEQALTIDPLNGHWQLAQLDDPGSDAKYGGSLQTLKDHLADLSQALEPEEPDEVTKSSGNAESVQPLLLSSFKEVGAKPGGTNPGGLYVDEATGDKWMMKGNLQQAKGQDGHTSDDRAKNEVLASELMKAAGIAAPTMKLMDLEGEHGTESVGPGSLGVATKMIGGLADWEPTAENVKDMQSQFAVHAWLANHDVMGTGNDNVKIGESGPISIDPGGALLFRAQGEPKGQFDESASEWEKMRDPSVNPFAAAVFADMTPQQLFDSAKKLSKISTDQIIALVEKFAPSVHDADLLAEKLVARKNAILNKASQALAQSKGTAGPLTPAAPPPNQLSSTEKDYIVNSHVGKVIKEAGFKKAKDSATGDLTFTHPSGASVVIHPPASGKKSSSKWTHAGTGGEQTKGDGIALGKLLAKAVSAAEAPKAATPDLTSKMTGAQKVDSSNLEAMGWKPTQVKDKSMVLENADGDMLEFFSGDSSWGVKKADGTFGIAGQGFAELGSKTKAKAAPAAASAKPTVVSAAEVPKVGKTPMAPDMMAYASKDGTVNAPAYLKSKGYEIVTSPGGGIVQFANDGAKIELDTKTGKWLSINPSYMTSKSGDDMGSLSILLAGKKVEKPYPWVNTNESTLYVDPAAAQKAKAAEATAKAAKSKAAGEEAAKKAAKEAEFGEHMKKVEAANAKAGATQATLQAAAPKPTAQEASAATKYTGSAYHAWNDKLRHQPGYMDANTEHLDSYMQKATFPEDVTVFRKVSGEYSKILRSIITEGTKFVDHGYVSTTTHSGVWYGDLQFVISVKAGQRGGSLKNLSHFSGENEVLLPRSTAFVVDKFDREAGIAYVTLDQSQAK